MQSACIRILTVVAFVGLGLVFLPNRAFGQYSITNLTSNQQGQGNYTDPLLVNPTGLAYAPSGPFWVSDEGSGWSTLYNGSGQPQSLQVTVPSASGTGQGTPTGIAYNGSQEFQIVGAASIFLFVTLDGTIQGWTDSDPSTTQIAVNNFSSGAVYTGLGITSKSSGNYLYAADFANDEVDIFDGGFNFVSSFTDPKVPRGFAPFNVQDIGGQLYVSFASTTGKRGGLIDIFAEDGTLLKRLPRAKQLDAPWGLAIAPSNFGPLSGSLLVANFTSSGTINAFSLETGKFVGTVTNSQGQAIEIDGLLGIEFGGGSSNNGSTNALYFTSGPNGGANGLFGVIEAPLPSVTAFAVLNSGVDTNPTINITSQSDISQMENLLTGLPGASKPEWNNLGWKGYLLANQGVSSFPAQVTAFNGVIEIYQKPKSTPQYFQDTNDGFENFVAQLFGMAAPTGHLCTAIQTWSASDRALKRLSDRWLEFSREVSGLPYKPGDWNGPDQNQPDNNCYNYACNDKTNTFAQPGRASKQTLPCPGDADFTCKTWAANAVKDGLVEQDCSKACEGKTHKVALVVDTTGEPGWKGGTVGGVCQEQTPDLVGPDYHWYQQNDDAGKISWSHKPGQTEAINKDSSNKEITDPAKADRRRMKAAGGFYAGYANFCGCLCVDPAKVKINVEPHSPDQ